MKLPEYKRNYELEQHYWWFVGVRAMVQELLTLSVRDKNLGKVLDVGCGTGALMDQLQACSEELLGVDISPGALNYCSLRGHKNLLLTDASHTALPSAYFDVITAIGIIEHLEDDEAFLVEMKRILKPGGIIILLTSSFPYLWSMHDTANEHKRRYYLRLLNRKINTLGLETTRISHLNFFLFPLIAPMLILHRLIYGIESEYPQRIMPNLPRLINALLTQLLIFEAKLMRWIHFPWGISMIGVFRKPTCAS
jgi:ubiquinone/menaquinone biosynthesis C-methylase UbiE